SRRRHTRFSRDWSSDVCSSDLTHRVANSAASAMVSRENPSAERRADSEATSRTRTAGKEALIVPPRAIQPKQPAARSPLASRARPSRRAPPATARARHARGASPGRSGASDRKSTRLNSSHVKISYAVFCLKKKKKQERK